jgi:hypothetical protein
MEKITFGVGGNAHKFQAGGWSEPEDSFTWAVGSNAELLLPRDGVRGEVFIFIRLCPFLNLPLLASQRLSLELDGVPVFKGRCWGDHRLAIRFNFDSVDKEFARLIADFPDAVQPIRFGVNDTRILAFMWRSIEIIEIEVPETADNTLKEKPVRINQAASLEHTLDGWAEEELRPWRLHPPRRLESDFIFAHLNATTHWAAIYRFHDGQVDFIPKPAHIALDPVVFDRAQLYLRFFRSFAAELSSGFEATVCVCAADFPMRVAEVPIFAFQKSCGMETILLPDIDFLLNNFFIELAYKDRKGYYEKKVAAVFAGATTGGEITREVVDSASLPRLSSATYFAGSERIDFFLPVIVQCISAEAEKALRSKSFCRKPLMTWQQQCDYRFQISMDGNGAACSRLALSLLSNSVLLKYDSPERLYYFNGLTPWEHFIPISEDRDVERVIAEELANPGRFSAIASQGRSFALQFLNERAIARYTALLLMKYGDIFVD